MEEYRELGDALKAGTIVYVDGMDGKSGDALATALGRHVVSVLKEYEYSDDMGKFTADLLNWLVEYVKEHD